MKRLEAINARKSVIHRVLEEIIEFQKEFILSGRPESMLPLDQKTVAARIGVSPSMVSRAAGKEVALRDFFPSKKDVAKSVIKVYFLSEKNAARDEAVRKRVMELYGVRVSRHLVQIYRRELGIPSAAKRGGGIQKR